MPPEYLTSGEELTLEIAVAATGSQWGGAGFWTRAAERFETVPGSVVGKNPFDKVLAGQWSGGYVPSDRGSIKVAFL